MKRIYRQDEIGTFAGFTGWVADSAPVGRDHEVVLTDQTGSTRAALASEVRWAARIMRAPAGTSGEQ